LRAGALQQLFGGFSTQALFTGLFVDEFRDASPIGGFVDDQRSLTPTNPGNYPFTNLSSARINALIAIPSLKQYAPAPRWHVGELYALVGATELMFAENLCSGVSLAEVRGFTPAYGPTLSRSQLLAQVLTDLDSAGAYAMGSDSIVSLVAVLRGRALVDSGNLAAAAAAVQGVPTGFVYTAELDSTTASNAVYLYTLKVQNVSVADGEGVNGLPFVSAADPRVPTLAFATSSGTIYADANIITGSVPLTVASGVEARLIQAEAALGAMQTSVWASTLNALRQTAIVPSIPPLSSDSTTSASVALQRAVLFRERAFWLFATGHRHGDLRRLVREYGLPATAVFPTGPYEGGPQTYGTSVVYPVGGDQYNPNYRGCLDSSA
jgi:hypothetical protein